MKDAWDVLGAVAGAGGTLTAALAIWQSSVRAKNEAIRDEANTIRQEIRALNASLERVLPGLRTGETILAIYEGVSQAFHRHFDFQNLTELNAAMDVINGRISLLVRFMAEDPVATACAADNMALQITESSLAARLPIFSSIAKIINSIVTDSTSAVFLANFFKPEMRPMILRDLDPSATASAIENEIASQISSNAALYFAARYDKAIKIIDELVPLLTRLHLSLRDEELRALASRAKTLDPDSTHTGGMRNYLKIAAPFIGKANAANLVGLVDRLETAVKGGGR